LGVPDRLREKPSAAAAATNSSEVKANTMSAMPVSSIGIRRA
jgi:hypothetical protein